MVLETTTIEGLRASGLPFVDATLETVGRCQDAFAARSPRIAAFRRAFGHELGGEVRYIDVPAAPARRCA
jgi:hypothetical protein